MNQDVQLHIENEKGKLLRRLWPNAQVLLDNAKPLNINIKRLIKSMSSPKLIFITSDPGKVYRLGLELIEAGTGNRSIQFDDLSIIRVDGPRNNQWVPPEFIPQGRTKSVVLCPTVTNNRMVLETFITTWLNRGARVICVCTTYDLEKSFSNVINLDDADLEL